MENGQLKCKCMVNPEDMCEVLAAVSLLTKQTGYERFVSHDACDLTYSPPPNRQTPVKNYFPATSVTGGNYMRKRSIPRRLSECRRQSNQIKHGT